MTITKALKSVTLCFLDQWGSLHTPPPEQNIDFVEASQLQS